jgi:hypothetical protein
LLKLDTNTFDHVIFLHVHKTAGTTLNTVLTYQYGWNSSVQIDQSKRQEERQKLEEMPQKQLQQIKLLRGHIPFGWHNLLPGNSVYITCLRDPVDRLISQYYKSKQTPDSVGGRLVAKYDTLLEFVESKTSTRTNNDFVRQFSGMNPPYGECTNDMLALAKKNLEKHFVAVGLTEQFDKSLIIIARALRWRKPLFYVRNNVTKHRPVAIELDPATADAIARDNMLDIELYTYIRKRFDSFWEENASDLVPELAKLRRRNIVAQKVLPGPLKIYRSVRSMLHK